MSKILRRILNGILILVVLLAALAGGAAVTFTKILPPQSFPQIDGSLRVPGLEQAVDIYRDPYGIPNIYAATRHDLFFAQGYVHAQDRFWQMDFWRHIGAGRLAEMFGKGQVETDIFIRRLGWARVAQQEMEAMDPWTRAILEAYAEGVNAYLKDHQGTALSLEYSVLKLLAPDYRIEPWTPVNTLTWAKAMAWDLRGNMDEEGDRSVLLKLFSQEQVNELYPAYPGDRPSIVTGGAAGQGNPIFTTGAAQEAVRQASDAGQIAAVRSRAQALDELLGPVGVGIGSNNWVISGRLSATGKPFLANDPHLGPQMPSIWYEVGLHCQPKSTE